MSFPMSSVEDPEKHFLGNLLDDESFSAPPPPRRENSGAIRSVSVTNNVGPISESFWPEPPPPYSPAESSASWLGNVAGVKPPVKPSPLADLLHTGLREPSEWDSMHMLHQDSNMYSRQLPPVHSLNSDSSISLVQQPQIHHHHHNLHHHTHMHNVVENHHHYLPPGQLEHPPGFPHRPQPQPFSAVVSRSKENIGSSDSVESVHHEPMQVLDAPHSAPVVNKMPFSYRDVAARNEPPGSGHSPPQMSRRGVSSSSIGVSASTMTGGSPEHPHQNQHRFSNGSGSNTTDDSISMDSDNSHSARVQKMRSEQEFKRISSKKGGKAGKDKKLLCDALSLPIGGGGSYSPSGGSFSPTSASDMGVGEDGVIAPPPVTATRFQLLETLSASPKIVKNTEGNGGARARVAPHVVPVDTTSRSSSIVPVDDERIRKNGVGMAVEGAKKKSAATSTAASSSANAAQTKRRGGNIKKRNGSDYWLLMLVWSYVVCACDTAQNGFMWLMTLVVDVCSNVIDITSFAITTFTTAVATSIRDAFLSVFRTISYYIACVRHFDLRSVIGGVSEKDESRRWGLDDNIIIPVTGDEAIARLLRLSHVDAYSVLGLRVDCSDDDVRRHHKRLAALFSGANCCAQSDKLPVDGCEEAAQLISAAFLAIGEPESRKAYNLATLHKNATHGSVIACFEALRESIHEIRNSMMCDCGHRHARIPTTIKTSEARQCRRCATTHAAKSNEIWVETRLWGLQWVYFTCADGVVYDISDWATCEVNYLKHMRPNAHTVQYRLVSPPVAGAGVASEKSASKEDVEQQGEQAKSARPGAAHVSFQPREEDRSQRRGGNRRNKRR